MNIGFDAKRAFLNDSGLGNYSRSLIHALLQFEPTHNYTLFTTKKGKRYFQNNLQNLTTITPKGFLNQQFSAVWRSQKIAALLPLNKIDVYHGLSHELPQNIEKTTTKSVVTVHDLIFIRYPETYAVIDRNIYRKKIKYSCEIADKIIAISQQTKDDLVEFLSVNPAKIEVIYQNCAQQFKIVAAEDEKTAILKKYNLPENYILSVGTIEKRKNVGTLIQAYQQANNNGIDLVVVGKSTPYLKEIKKLISPQFRARIHFIHEADFPDFPAIYQQAKLFVYPSVFEGFGIPIIEALYSKTPVITSQGSCFSEAGGKHSIYVNPTNIEELSAAISDVLNDEKQQQLMIEKGFDFVQQFNDEKMANQLMKLYHELKN